MSGLKPTNDLVLDEFKAQLAQHGITIDTINDDGLITIQRGDVTLEVSLDNVRRNYARDNDKQHITELVDALVTYDEAGIEQALPGEWETVQAEIFPSLFPKEDFDFENFLHHSVSEDVVKVYLYAGNSRHTWISETDLEQWQVTEEDIIRQANANADRLLAEAGIEIEDIDGRKLGAFSTPYPGLKASLLLAPSLRDRISDDFGFPFFAVVPVRDFCYFFSEADAEYLLARLGPTVVDEFQESGYPITTEVWRFTDAGIQTVGRYPVTGETD